MTYADWMAHQMVGIARFNHRWMLWNLLLAAVPAVLAVVLFQRPHRRVTSWWVEAAAFALLLPNAPYVITDLVHLPVTVDNAPTRSVVLVVVLPLYGAFVLGGLLAYLVCTEGVLREVRSWRPTTPRWAVEGVVHLFCAVGIVVGRITRLNSWDPLRAPSDTLGRILLAFTWSGTPVAVVSIFAVVALAHVGVRALVVGLGRLLRGAHRRVRPIPVLVGSA